MTYANRLALRVKKVLKKQVRDKGYEVDALLTCKEGGEGLGIKDYGDSAKTVFSVMVKIIITSHDIEQFPMELGDNPDDMLDFIWLPPDGFIENTGDNREVEEGRIIRYMGKDYSVIGASPTWLGGNLVIKECRARMVR